MKKLFAILMSIMMIACFMPTMAFAAGYDVTITLPTDGHITKTDDSGNLAQSGVESEMQEVVCKATEGYYFPTDYASLTKAGESNNGITVVRTDAATITISGTPTAAVTIDLAAATGKVKEATPDTVGFEATGYNIGKLIGLSAGLVYKIDSGVEQKITLTENQTELELNNLNPCTISVVKKGGETTTDSDAKEITITRADPPAVASTTPCTANGSADGKITGVSDTMEYREKTDSTPETWTPINGTEVTGLAAGTYAVRVKAKDQALASDAAEVTITEPAAKQTIPDTVMSAITGNTVDYNGTPQAAVTVGEAVTGDYTVMYKVKDADDATYTTDVPEVTAVADSKKITVKVSKVGFADRMKDVDVTVTAKDIAGAEITLGEKPEYNGTAQTIEITGVKVDNLTLTTDDYNVTGNTATDVEDTTLTLTGKGNFTGEATKVWTLQKATPKAEDFTLPTLNSVVYGTDATVTAPTTAKTGMGTVTVKYNGETTVPTAVGTYTVTFDVADGKNYSAATGLEIGTITITAKQLTIAAAATNRAYEAGNKEVDVTLTLDPLGIITDDEVGLAATTVKGTMADANVGTGKAVTVTATPELTGAAAGNYTLAAIPAVTVNITAIDYTGEKAHTEKANAGARVSCDLTKDFTLPEGCKFGEIVVADADSILEDGTKIVEGKLNFAIKSGAAVGKKATIKIPVTSTNYNSFDIVITAEVTQKSSGSGGGSYYPYTPSTPSKPAAPNLDKTKTDSTTALNAAATANKYDAAEQAEVKKILDKANADIKNAKTEAEVKAIEEAAQAEIDKILTTEEKATVAALDNVEKRDFETKSKVITRKSGKKVIRLTWTAPDGVDVDGYEIFRSTKKNSGFGTKPYFETTSTSYTNTKNLKPGKIYYYKVRAFVVINGERVYTDYSMKAFRTIK